MLGSGDGRGGLSRRWFLLPAVILGFGVILVLGIKLAKGNQSLGEVKLHPYPAPLFNVSLFNGGNFSLADQRGKMVVVNFWASWCDPCKAEAPVLESASQRYRADNVDFVGIDIKDTPEDARAFLTRYAATYPNAFDSEKQIYIDYGVYGLPETFVIDPQGLVVHHVVGPVTAPQLDTWLKPFTDAHSS